MKTGIDASLHVNRSEGYPVVEHGKSPMDPSKEYHLTISNPPGWTDSGKTKFGYKGPLYQVDSFVSYINLWESFERGGNGIKAYCDFDRCPFPPPSESPTFNDFVLLASVVHSYNGVDEF